MENENKQTSAQSESQEKYQTEEILIQLPHGTVRKLTYINKNTGIREKILEKNETNGVFALTTFDHDSGAFVETNIFNQNGNLVLTTRYMYDKESGLLSSAKKYNSKGELVGIDNYSGVRSWYEEDLKRRGVIDKNTRIEDDLVFAIAESLAGELDDPVGNPINQ